MSPRSLALAALEEALNRYIRLDPDAPARFSELHGRVIAVHLTGLELTLYFVAEPSGGLQVYSHIEQAPDCRLSGSPLDLARSREGPQGARQLFAGRITVEGDTELAQRFGVLLAGLDIDWEEQLSHFTGDLLAHRLGRGARGAARYLKAGWRTAERNVGEYVSEEARLVPTRGEYEGWAGEVEATRDAVERLEARLNRLLEHARNGKGMR
jgi:ubiquinone biosynthesis protein UbiJ